MMQYLYVIGAVHLLICPFTKVEESFNLQAMHDLIFYKLNVTEFDHLEFPGVVPRTFLGPLVTAILLSPILTALNLLGIFTTHKFLCQYLVRATIGSCVLFALSRLHKTLKEIFGDGVAFWFSILTASQYHFMFYLSRPLPNIMVLPLVLLAINFWIKRDHEKLICVSAAAVIIFRFELAIFLGLIILIEVLYGNIHILRVLKIGVLAGICSIAFTVAVDSFFWNRLVWPEGEVFWFNVILNKSSRYGVSPMLWYWYSALPRALGASIMLVPFGVKPAKILVAPALLFVIALSFLPHKELRFIICTFPLFNISAASACDKLWKSRHNSFMQWFISIFVALHLLVNLSLSCFLLKVASENYPGGFAITRLHKLVPPSTNAHVYIDNFAAQTGVSRFTQLHPHWIYNKTENLPHGSQDYFLFTHLLLEAKSKYSPNLKPFMNTHEVIDVVEGFSHLHFHYKSFPPFKIKSKPMIFILKQNDNLSNKYKAKTVDSTQYAATELNVSKEETVIPQTYVKNEVVVSNESFTDNFTQNIQNNSFNYTEKLEPPTKVYIPNTKDESSTITKPPKISVDDLFDDSNMIGSETTTEHSHPSHKLNRVNPHREKKKIEL